jgi:hypothetical protein
MKGSLHFQFSLCDSLKKSIYENFLIPILKGSDIHVPWRPLSSVLYIHEKRGQPGVSGEGLSRN